MENNYNLNRFIEAQNRDYDIALAEIRAGKKVSHWMWYIFPQLKGLGRSSTSEYYGLSGIKEAQAYLSDPILKARLIEITDAVIAHKDKSAEEIFGGIDAKKLRSCMTLFSIAAPDIPVFEAVLEQFFHGVPDRNTLRLTKYNE
ncbi:MAG: DUF1810 domain-containing protein [Clostridia bacterium]|nr:DUF1810 domain-containing protein [Clostridia bacterium]